jgi:hypothetical protein
VNFFRRLGSKKGQATTEMVLMFPLFMFFLFGFVKIFALLVLVQKIEVAGYYAARRWQLESHRNFRYEASFDDPILKKDIQAKVREYLGCDSRGIRDFLELDCGSIRLEVQRTQVWNIVKLTVPTRRWRIPLMKFKSKDFVVTKYVPNRDRPIGFRLPEM